VGGVRVTAAGRRPHLFRVAKGGGQGEPLRVRRAAFAVTLGLASAALGCAGGELGVVGAGRIASAAEPAHPFVRAEYAAPDALATSEPPVWAAPTGPSVTDRQASPGRLEPEAPPRVAGAAPADDGTAAILSNSSRCPAEMALVEDRVCVDRWEASIVELVTSRGPSRGSEERAWSPFVPIDGHERQVRAVSRPGVMPQAYISGKQAATACGASGKRLCAVDEWEHACRGPSNFQFPYGDQRRAGVCNDDIRPVHPVAEVGHMLGIPHQRLWQEGMNQPLINQLPNTLLPTGDRAECTNEYGVYDMVGNLHEWVDDPDGTFRGGYYMDTTKNGDGCSYQTTAHDFAYHDYSTGFRCCMDPERVE